MIILVFIFMFSFLGFVKKSIRCLGNHISLFHLEFKDIVPILEVFIMKKRK